MACTPKTSFGAPAWARSIKINADQDQMVQVKIHLIINAQHGCKEGLCPDSLDMWTALSPLAPGQP